MSTMIEYEFGDRGTEEEAQARLAWASRRVRVVAQGDVRNGVPFVEGQNGPPGMNILLLPFAGQRQEEIEAAAFQLRRERGGIRLRVGFIEVDGYPLQGEKLPLSVLLATRGNPDHGQDPTQPPWGMPPDRFVSVASMEEAKTVVAQFLQNNDVGGSQWVGGDVWQGGRRLGGIAYNGRFFEAGDARGYGKPSVEFGERMNPSGSALRKLLAKASLDSPMDDLDYTHDPEFALSRFAGIRSPDEWRSWYAAEVEKEPGLGSRTLAPALDPIIVEVRDEEAQVVSAIDERRVGAAFLRGDACINAVVVERPAPRLTP